MTSDGSGADGSAEVIKAAMAVAKDAAEGHLSADQLDAELTEACRGLFGVVAGPGDPVWELQIDVARQVLAAGGLSAAEVAEWLAVTRRREPAQAEADNPPPNAISSASGPHSPENGDPVADAADDHPADLASPTEETEEPTDDQ